MRLKESIAGGDIFFVGLEYFKRLWKIGIVRSHGESGDADHESIAATLPKFREKLTGSALEESFNANECRLNYRMGQVQLLPMHLYQIAEKARRDSPFCSAVMLVVLKNTNLR